MGDYAGSQDRCRRRDHAACGDVGGETTGTWEKIIDLDTFHRLQLRFGNEVVNGLDGLRLIKIGTGRRKVSMQRHLITGYLWCGKCETERMRLMKSGNSKDKSHYICAGCASNTVDVAIAEEFVTVRHSRCSWVHGCSAKARPSMTR